MKQTGVTNTQINNYFNNIRRRYKAKLNINFKERSQIKQTTGKGTKFENFSEIRKKQNLIPEEGGGGKISEFSLGLLNRSDPVGLNDDIEPGNEEIKENSENLEELTDIIEEHSTNEEDITRSLHYCMEDYSDDSSDDSSIAESEIVIYHSKEKKKMHSDIKLHSTNGRANWRRNTPPEIPFHRQHEDDPMNEVCITSNM